MSGDTSDDLRDEKKPLTSIKASKSKSKIDEDPSSLDSVIR